MESPASPTLSRWPGPEHADLTKRSTARALAWAIPDLLAWIGLVALAVAPLPLLVNVMAAILAGMFIGILFVVGHDASHQALTPQCRLNPG